ncbi:molecular chaperone OsmY [Enterobacillus tribolii]|uniref:Osmotically-inducible protein Y n=1 Tax=Enterobacillus tribolii TaxID=1487935 RepID=A0A370QQ68_9GAMM|nr:molecular chaperone OsmY [Enterobacillus tribolii]MBW7981551.1 molecular chaperone OsmY [Enterobacillus tribolii]RDK90928.1 hyperosmotically inducible protein [Enterobacillus tribolii]
MKNSKFARSMMAIVLGSVLVSTSVFAEESLMDKAKNVANDAGAKIDSSMKKVDGYMSDSAITARVKSALVDAKAIQSNDISVVTEKGAVTLNGFVSSQEQAEQAVTLTKGVDGVKSVNDKLHVKDGTKQSVGGYVDDSKITGEVKTKLLADDIVPSRHVKVETSNGIVQLSGTVENQAQSERAQSIAGAVKGVKSVKNDLSVKP